MLTIPCVAAILYNTDRQVLLMQRDEKPSLEFAGWWTLPGGRIEAGETPAAAIERELREEIEIVPARHAAGAFTNARIIA